MLYRYATYKGDDISQSADIGSFPDNAYVSSYAEQGMAVGCRLITGKNGNLDPQGSAVHAQTATIIYRFR